MDLKLDSSAAINRELSWLDFNSRVLDQAADPGNPLLERVKFLAIFSSNLDEFFMVRVASLKQAIDSGHASKIDSPAGMSAEDQLEAILATAHRLVQCQYALLNETLLPELLANGRRVASILELDEDEKKRLERHFLEEIFPTLTPVGVDPSHPFPVVNNKAINICVQLRRSGSDKIRFGFVEVPPALTQFIRVRHPGDAPASLSFVLVEELISAHLDKLFTGCEMISAFLFRITKDMDLSSLEEDDDIPDFLRHMEKILLSTKRRKAVRMEISSDAPYDVAKWLAGVFDLGAHDVFPAKGPLSLARFFEFLGAARDERLFDSPLPPLPNPQIPPGHSMFDLIKRHGSIPLFLPFQSFEPVVRFLNDAADDPSVLAVKQTLYRAGSGDPAVVAALRRAAENGKQVTAVVELKARFDEGRNILWSKRLEESGAHVIYGMSGLKIHGKAALVIRREDGVIRRYVHLSTGNYNEATSKVYTDIGMFTDNPEICADVSDLFNLMSGFSDPPRLRRICIAPFYLRGRFCELIDREARIAAETGQGSITAKVNSLVDPEIMFKLRNAAAQGVTVSLIVRGVCGMKPDKEGRIKIVSVIDRFLEHTRIFRFGNAGRPEYYLASADWMGRNLDRRIEIMFPVDNPGTREMLDKLIEFQLGDLRKGRSMLPDGRYTPLNLSNDESRSQIRTYEYLRDKSRL